MTDWAGADAVFSPLLAADIDLDRVAEFKDQIVGFVEVALLTWFFYAMLRFLHGTRGLAVVKGLLIALFVVAAGLFLLSISFDISFTRLEVVGLAAFPILPVVLIVLFQPEIRRGFSRLSERPLGGRSAPSQLADLAKSFVTMGKQRIGALVVFEQQTGFKSTQGNGVQLDAALSGAMLESIFYPKSPLHDGAVIVAEGRVVAASVTLPLTESTEIARELGTRHRAAIGVTEETDAVAVVVSEETGKVTVVHHGELQPARDDELVDVLRQRLQLDRRKREEGRTWNPYRLVRRDIGRKLSAVFLACFLWFVLQAFVVGERTLALPVRVVRSVAEAEQQRASSPAIYVVVPDGLIADVKRLRQDKDLNRLRSSRVEIDVKGLREQIQSLELSAILEINDEQLVGEDENIVRFNLNVEDLFKVKSGEQPEYSEFEVKPKQLSVPIARETTGVFELTSANVEIEGRPRAGYAFDPSDIRISPNLVAVSGPKKRLDELRSDPAGLRLRTLVIEGKSSQVSQDIGLSPDLGELTLLTGGGQVTVTVPIDSVPYSVELPFVRVRYINADALPASKRRMVSATESVDLLVTGPEAELYSQSEEWLRERIFVVFDWSEASFLQAEEKVSVFTQGLSDEVEITTPDGRAPQIEYQLEAALGGMNDGDS